MRWIVYFVLCLTLLHLLHTDSSEQKITRYSYEASDSISCDVVKQWITFLESKDIKFPMVALAQATWETNFFRSKICKSNRNLFGMKYNKRGFALKTLNGHAYYENAKQSIADYKAWQDRMLRLHPCNTEEEYLQMLDSLPISTKYNTCRYAEDTTYTDKIRMRINELKKIK